MISARLFLPLIVLCLLLTACGDSSPTSANSPIFAVQPTKTVSPTQPNLPFVTITPGPSQNEDEIQEALLRYRFAEATGSVAYPTSYYFCLGIETAARSPDNLLDPPQALLDRFQGNNPQVVKASDCVMDQQQQRVIEKNSGQQATFWGLGSVTHNSLTKVDLELSYLYQFNGTGGSEFQLEWQNGKWVVTGYSVIWIA